MACTVVAGLANNAAFPAPTVDFKAVQAAAVDLNAALAAQAHGVKSCGTSSDVSDIRLQTSGLVAEV